MKVKQERVSGHEKRKSTERRAEKDLDDGIRTHSPTDQPHTHSSTKKKRKNDPRDSKQDKERDLIFLSFGLSFFTPSTPNHLISTFKAHGGHHYPCSALKPGDLALNPKSTSQPVPTLPRSEDEEGKEKRVTVMDIDYYFVIGDNDPLLPLLRRRPFVLFRAEWVLDSVAAGKRLSLEQYIVDQPFQIPRLRNPTVESSNDRHPLRYQEHKERKKLVNHVDTGSKHLQDQAGENSIPPQASQMAITNPIPIPEGTASTLPTVFVDALAFTSQRALVNTSLGQLSSSSKPNPKSKTKTKSDAHSNTKSRASTPRSSVTPVAPPSTSGKRTRPTRSSTKQYGSKYPRIVDLTHLEDDSDGSIPPPSSRKGDRPMIRGPFPSPESRSRSSTIRTIGPDPRAPSPKSTGLDLQNKDVSVKYPDTHTLRPDLRSDIKTRAPDVKSEHLPTSTSTSTSTFAPPTDTRSRAFRELVRHEKVFDFEDVYEGLSSSQTPHHRFGTLEPA